MNIATVLPVIGFSESASVGLSLVVAFLVSACAASFANYCVDACGWTPRSRSPWRPLPKVGPGAALTRPLGAKIPIAGWILLARSLGDKNSYPYASVPGCESRRFWIRPFLIELCFALFMTWRFQTVAHSSSTLFETWAFWAVEAVFFWFLLCAAFVDFDDYIIPDALTITGTLIALVLSFGSILVSTFTCRDLFNPEAFLFSPQTLFLELIQRSSGTQSALPTPENLAAVDVWTFWFCSFIWTFWAFALLDRRFYPRFGLRKACAIFCRRLRRSILTPIVGVVWILGLIAVYFIAMKQGSYASTLEPAMTSRGEPGPVDFFIFSLWGLFVGMTMIWAVRIVGGASLGKEAMGFGDVILAGLIGAFLGWQGAVVVFFIAPFFGLVFGVARLFFSRTPMIPYGPFLALASVVYVVFRTPIQEATGYWFDDAFFLMGIGVVGLVMLGVMLVLLRLVKKLLRR